MAILDLMGGHCFFFSRTTHIFSISPAWPGAEKKKKKKTEREKEFYSHKVYDFHVFLNQVGDGNRNFVVLKQYKSQARPQIIGGPKKKKH